MPPSPHVNNETTNKPGPSNYKPVIRKEEGEVNETLTWLEKLKRVDCINVPAGECNPAESDCDEFDINLPKRLTKDDINSIPYFREVKRMINNYMDIGIESLKTQGHWKMFLLKKAYKKGKSYKMPDPSYDAWMCVTGERRDVFHVKDFVIRYPSVKLYLKEIRKLCNVCLPFKDVEKLNDDEYVADVYDDSEATEMFTSPALSDASTIDYCVKRSIGKTSITPHCKETKKHKEINEEDGENVSFSITSTTMNSTLTTPSLSKQKGGNVMNVSSSIPPYFHSPTPTRLTRTFPSSGGGKLNYIVKRQMNPSLEKWN